jgi:hypothetical protein
MRFPCRSSGSDSPSLASTLNYYTTTWDVTPHTPVADAVGVPVAISVSFKGLRSCQSADIGEGSSAGRRPAHAALVSCLASACAIFFSSTDVLNRHVRPAQGMPASNLSTPLPSPPQLTGRYDSCGAAAFLTAFPGCTNDSVALGGGTAWVLEPVGPLYPNEYFIRTNMTVRGGCGGRRSGMGVCRTHLLCTSAKRNPTTCRRCTTTNACCLPVLTCCMMVLTVSLVHGC